MPAVMGRGGCTTQRSRAGSAIQLVLNPEPSKRQQLHPSTRMQQPHPPALGGGSHTQPSVMWITPLLASTSGSSTLPAPTISWPAHTAMQTEAQACRCNSGRQGEHRQPGRAWLPHQCQHPPINSKHTRETHPPALGEATGSCWPPSAVTLPAERRSAAVRRRGTMDARMSCFNRAGSCKAERNGQSAAAYRTSDVQARCSR